MSENNINRGRPAEKRRESGIELLKIFAIFIIVISHTVQTLRSQNLDIPFQDYVYDVTYATTDIRSILFIIMSHFGAWGNTIFFVCSAWFLLKSDRYKKRKWLFMLVEIWVISIIILVITYVILHGGIPAKMIIKNLFPTLFMNNWYMTCYLLFYPIHPLLNKLIYRMSQKALFRAAFALSFLYIGMDTIKGDWFFPSALILWVAIYFVMAYMQFYMKKFSESVKANVIMLVVNAFFFIALILVTDFLGLHISFFNDKTLHWASNCNMFLILMTIAMFNLARHQHFKNRAINYVSKLSLLIYIIHENLILRTYFRPRIWEYVYTHYGYSHVVGWSLLIALGIFLFGVAAAAIYERSLQRAVTKFSNWLYDELRRIYLWFEYKSIKLLQ